MYKNVNLFRHAFLCNLLTEIMRPRYEDPIDTAKDMAEKNIKLLRTANTAESFVIFFKRLNITEYTIIADNMYPVDTNATNMDKYLYSVEHDIHGAGTHAVMANTLHQSVVNIAPLEKWWKSKESVPALSPFVSPVVIRKQWIMKEIGGDIFCVYYVYILFFRSIIFFY